MVEGDDTFSLVAALIALGLGLALWIYTKIKRHRAHIWPTVEGKVVSSEVKYEMTGMDPNTHIETKAWVVRMNYSYTLEGTTYSGRVRHNFSSRDRADDWISDFPEGRALIIRYNPKKHSDSELFEREQPEKALRQAS